MYQLELNRFGTPFSKATYSNTSIAKDKITLLIINSTVLGIIYLIYRTHQIKEEESKQSRSSQDEPWDD
jgi:hypothetical protein